MDRRNIGFAGLGNRGTGLLRDVILLQGECAAAVCDEYADRAETGAVMDVPDFTNGAWHRRG